MHKKTSGTVQNGNPKGFTLDQHVFPASAIKRFGSGPELRVHVHKLDFNIRKHYVPGAELFCAFRAWDQATEHARSRITETSYEALADGVASGAVQHLTPEQNQIVSDFYGLWNARHLVRTRPIESLSVPGASGETPLTWEARENLEANGYVFTQAGTFPPHIAGAIQVMGIRLRENRALTGCQWGIVRASSGEFLVPDNCVSLLAVPVAPTVCLVGNVLDLAADATEVAQVNGVLLQQAHAYYFARDLKACPLPLGTRPGIGRPR
jgi:hypothetical protein